MANCPNCRVFSAVHSTTGCVAPCLHSFSKVICFLGVKRGGLKVITRAALLLLGIFLVGFSNHADAFCGLLRRRCVRVQPSFQVPAIDCSRCGQAQQTQVFDDDFNNGLGIRVDDFGRIIDDNRFGQDFGIGQLDGAFGPTLASSGNGFAAISPLSRTTLNGAPLPSQSVFGQDQSTGDHGFALERCPLAGSNPPAQTFCATRNAETIDPTTGALLTQKQEFPIEFTTVTKTGADGRPVQVPDGRFKIVFARDRFGRERSALLPKPLADAILNKYEDWAKNDPSQFRDAEHRANAAQAYLASRGTDPITPRAGTPPVVRNDSHGGGDGGGRPDSTTPINNTLWFRWNTQFKGGESPNVTKLKGRITVDHPAGHKTIPVQCVQKGDETKTFDKDLILSVQPGGILGTDRLSAALLGRGADASAQTLKDTQIDLNDDGKTLWGIRRLPIANNPKPLQEMEIKSLDDNSEDLITKITMKAHDGDPGTVLLCKKAAPTPTPGGTTKSPQKADPDAIWQDKGKTPKERMKALFQARCLPCHKTAEHDGIKFLSNGEIADGTNKKSIADAMGEDGAMPKSKLHPPKGVNPEDLLPDLTPTQKKELQDLAAKWSQLPSNQQ